MFIDCEYLEQKMSIIALSRKYQSKEGKFILPLVTKD